MIKSVFKSMAERINKQADFCALDLIQRKFVNIKKTKK